MTAYVITPNGEVLSYPTANHALRIDGHIELHTDATKKVWVADIPATFAVGWARPTSQGQSVPLAQLKRSLRNYDSRTGRWKE